MILRKVVIDKLFFPVDMYHYDVKLLTSIDGGKNYCYAGFGKFAKNREEAEAIKQLLEDKNDIS